MSTGYLCASEYVSACDDIALAYLVQSSWVWLVGQHDTQTPVQCWSLAPISNAQRVTQTECTLRAQLHHCAYVAQLLFSEKEILRIRNSTFWWALTRARVRAPIALHTKCGFAVSPTPSIAVTLSMEYGILEINLCKIAEMKATAKKS